MILDTDTYNEADDQFALSYLLKNKEIFNIDAITIAPFRTEKCQENVSDSIDESYNEACKIFDLLGLKDKSIIYKGIASDMYDYKERGDNEIWSFRNFPYNSLGDNKLLYTNNSMNTFIKHPYNSRGNTKYSLLAPEIYNGIDVDSTEVTFEGYQLGYSEGQFKEVEGHAKWVIMGNKAEKLASEFASMKVAFQLAMNVTENTIQALIATSGGSFFGFGSAAAGGAAEPTGARRYPKSGR